MATITPLHIDSFGHSYFTVTLANGMYDGVSSFGAPDTTTPTVGGASRSMRVETATAEYVQLLFSTGKRIAMTTFYVRFVTSLPAEDCTLVRFVNATGSGTVGYDASENKLYGQVGTGTIVNGSDTFQVNRWYRVTAELDSSTGTATLRCTVDNGTEFSASNTQAADDINNCALGRIANVATARTILFNSWVVSETDGDYEKAAAWRQHCVEDIRPTSDGTHNIAASGDFDSDSSTAFSNSSTDIYTYVDQDPFLSTPGADDNLRQDVSGTTRYAEVVFENPAVLLPVIDGVRGVVAMVQDAGLGDSFQEARMFLSGGTEVLRAGSLHLVDSSVDHPQTNVMFFHRVMVAPGGSWDSSEVQGLKYRLGYSDGLPIPHTYNTLIEVLSHQEPGGQTVQTIVTER